MSIKDQDPENVCSSQPKSHQEWINLCDFIASKTLILKRVFVTATPESLVKY